MDYCEPKLNEVEVDSDKLTTTPTCKAFCAVSYGMNEDSNFCASTFCKAAYCSNMYGLVD